MTMVLSLGMALLLALPVAGTPKSEVKSKAIVKEKTAEEAPTPIDEASKELPKDSVKDDAQKPLPVADGPLGHIIAIRGTPRAFNETAGTHRDLQRGSELFKGDTLQTDDTATLRLMLRDKSTIDVGHRTTLVLNKLAAGKKRRVASLKLVVGKIWARVTSWLGDGSTFSIDTKNAVAGVRGTEFLVATTQTGDAWITVVGGSVEMTDRASGVSKMLDSMMVGRIDSAGFHTGAITNTELMAIMEQMAPGPSVSAKDKKALKARMKARKEGAITFTPVQPEPQLTLEPGGGKGTLTITIRGPQ